MKGDDFQKRKTKKDKAKRNFELYGKFSPKHIRQQEELQRVHAQRIDKNIDSTNTATNINNHKENTSNIHNHMENTTGSKKKIKDKN